MLRWHFNQRLQQRLRQTGTHPACLSQFDDCLSVRTKYYNARSPPDRSQSLAVGRVVSFCPSTVALPSRRRSLSAETAGRAPCRPRGVGGRAGPGRGGGTGRYSRSFFADRIARCWIDIIVRRATSCCLVPWRCALLSHARVTHRPSYASPPPIKAELPHPISSATSLNNLFLLSLLVFFILEHLPSTRIFLSSVTSPIPRIS